jgi:hypothetical protein
MSIKPRRSAVSTDIFKTQEQTATINSIDGDIVTIDNVPYLIEGKLKFSTTSFCTISNCCSPSTLRLRELNFNIAPFNASYIAPFLLDIFKTQEQTATINSIDGDIVTIDNVPYLIVDRYNVSINAIDRSCLLLSFENIQEKRSNILPFYFTSETPIKMR